MKLSDVENVIILVLILIITLMGLFYLIWLGLIELFTQTGMMWYFRILVGSLLFLIIMAVIASVIFAYQYGRFILHRFHIQQQYDEVRMRYQKWLKKD
jgi:hypothetical protein